MDSSSPEYNRAADSSATPRPLGGPIEVIFYLGCFHLSVN